MLHLSCIQPQAATPPASLWDQHTRLQPYALITTMTSTSISPPEYVLVDGLKSQISSATVAGKTETTALCCEPGFTATTSTQSGDDYVWRCYTNLTQAAAGSVVARLISPRQNFGAEPACAVC